jgi:imidazole glycerol-phosphate synthase subunit HisH
VANNIAIIDYGMGNLKSVQNALIEVGATGEIISAPGHLANFSKIILPGVGAFGDAARRLETSGLMEAVRSSVAEGRLLLGICLGMQLLCASSEESPSARGLGFFDVAVKKLEASNGQRVPHIGWNSIVIEQPHWIVSGIASASEVYFLHSYAADIGHGPHLIASARHTGLFPAIIARSGIIGIQFHPEKSQKTGLGMLRNFVEASAW